MCECLRHGDGTWHVDECCSWIMDNYHSGNYPDDEATRRIRRNLATEVSILLYRNPWRTRISLQERRELDLEIMDLAGQYPGPAPSAEPNEPPLF